MSQSTDIASPAVSFSEAVRAFAPVCANRYAKLLPFKDGMVELRQKGASYRLIRELLATADVAVAVDTTGNFVREVVEQRPPSRPGTRRRPVRALSEPSAARRLPTPDEPRSRSPWRRRSSSVPLTHPFPRRPSRPRPSRQRSVRALAARASPIPPISNRPRPPYIFNPILT